MTFCSQKEKKKKKKRISKVEWKTICLELKDLNEVVTLSIIIF